MIRNFNKISTNLLCHIKTVQISFANGIQSKPDFTVNNFKVTRGNYATLDEKHIVFFRDLLGENRIVMDLSDLEKYNVDWMKYLRGKSRIALKPKTTDEVSRILSFCNENRLAVCPQGGNTGMVGGANPVFDEVVISTELMNKIISLDDTSGILICEAGCVLQNINDHLSNYGLMMPLDLGAKGSCHIGGNVSTNAGGLRLLRYGNMQGNVLGLEVVKANGEVLDCLSSLKKDNTGYHLKHLFIGSEGTLGFVTKVAIQCPTKPKSVCLAFLGCQSFEKVLKAYKKAKDDLGEILSAVEVIDAASMELAYQHGNVVSPIGNYPFYLMLETSGSNEAHDEEKLNKYVETALLKHFILNGTISSEPGKTQAMWAIRERLVDWFEADGYVFMYDISIPLKAYYTLVAELREHMGDKSHRTFGYGHLGDGNIHLQTSVKEYTPEIKRYIEDFLYKRVAELKGSISAEHGLGFVKGRYLNQIKPPTSYNLMKDLKKMFDPNCILNPYKVVV